MPGLRCLRGGVGVTDEAFERAMLADDPPESLWWAAVWLTRRHERAFELCARAGVIDDQGDVDVDQLGEALEALDVYRAAWLAYQDTGAPTDDDAFERWQAAGPQHPETPAGREAAAIGVMSSTELGILRVLGTLANRPSRFGLAALWGFDNTGRAFLRDWLRVVAPWAEAFPDPFEAMTARARGVDE